MLRINSLKLKVTIQTSKYIIRIYVYIPDVSLILKFNDVFGTFIIIHFRMNRATN